MTNPRTRRAQDAESAFRALCDDPHAPIAVVTSAFDALCEAETNERNHTTRQLAGSHEPVSAVEAILARIDLLDSVTPANPDE